MFFSTNILSPIKKMFLGAAIIIIAVLLVIINKYSLLSDFLFGAGAGLELLAIFGFYQSYKLRNVNKDDLNED
jgi:hypothetical protein